MIMITIISIIMMITITTTCNETPIAAKRLRAGETFVFIQPSVP